MKQIIAVLVIFHGPLWALGDDALDCQVKHAVDKALNRIEIGLTNYPKHRQCFSCHHHAVGVMSMTAARTRGFAIDDPFLNKQIGFSLNTFRNKSLIAKGQGVGGDSTGVGYMLHTLAAVDWPYDDTVAALVEYLLVKQRKDGAWPIAAFGDRPPTMGSLHTNVGLALYVLKRYGPPQDASGAKPLQERIDSAIRKGRSWLLANPPKSTEDQVFHLRGLVDSGAEEKERNSGRDRLLKEQRKDGSWAQLSHMSGDAYATATALTALSHAGLAPNHEAYQKGIRYLLDTQTEDGAWIVQTRTNPLQRFFDNGDPGGKSQFISVAATNWAVMALLETLPKHPLEQKPSSQR